MCYFSCQVLASVVCVCVRVCTCVSECARVCVSLCVCVCVCVCEKEGKGCACVFWSSYLSQKAVGQTRVPLGFLWPGSQIWTSCMHPPASHLCTHTHTHTHTHTPHTHTHPCPVSMGASLVGPDLPTNVTLELTFSLLQCCPKGTHAHTNTHTHILTHTLKHTHSHTLTNTETKSMKHIL